MKSKLFIILLVLPSALFSQEISAPTDTIRKDALNVFMQADSYIKKEITFVNYVRDIKSADLYIIQSWQPTGSGGDAVTLFLVGQNRFEGMNDTVSISFSPDETEDVQRTKGVRLLKMALMRYMLKTPLASYFNVSFTVPVKETVSTDKWNSWVFRLNFSGDLQREKSYRSVSLSSGINISRITEKNKFTFDYSYSWDDSWYEYDDTRITSYYRSQYASTQYVIGLNDHWSVGAFGSINSSVYSNSDVDFSLMPAVEYDFFPYSLSTRRLLTLNYRIGYEYYDYMDTTLYNKTRESLFLHRLGATLTLVEKWGSVSLRASYSNYLHDWSKNNISLSGYISVRIAKGLNFNISGGGSIQHDQLSLPKRGASLEQVLLRRKEIASSFYLYSYFGISYTFGSIYNNAVNPRFSRGSYHF